MKIERIDRTTIRTINADSEAALAPVAEKHGVRITIKEPTHGQ